MLTNAEIASHLAELARLTTLAEGSSNAFRVRSYETAVRSVEEAEEAVAEMPPARLQAMRGIGGSTAAKIRELVETGRIARLEELRAEFPPEFVELTRIPGVGPKTAVMLRDELNVHSVDDLRAALDAEALRALPGMGAKTEANIRAALERLGATGKDRRTPILEATRIARDVVAALSTIPGVRKVEPMGSLRRFRETIGDIDVIAVSTGDPEVVMQRFVALPVVREVVGYGARKSAILTASGMQIDLRVMEPSQYGAAALYFTGSKAHNIRLRQMAIDRGWTLNEYGLTVEETGEVVAAAREQDVYAALGLPWIAPELREDTGEIEAALAGNLPHLVEVKHLRGDLHVHTNLSGDGRETLEKMLAAAADRGYAYVAITDHGEDLTINGATREQLLAQRKRIAALQKRHPDMTIYQGCELNIAPDGSIDYDPGFLADLDFGVASVHGQFTLSPESQTARVVAAMENPAVNVIGHLTGRRIGTRPGIDLDIEAVLTAAERTGCAIEINGHLDRLDAPAEVLRRARDRNVLFAISSDAHDTRELANIETGVRHAHRGWVERERVVNTWSASRFAAWVARKRAG